MATEQRLALGDGMLSQSPALTPTRSSIKGRSMSDLPRVLSPSPSFLESSRATKDDTSLSSNPRTPQRSLFPVRGLSIQMPVKDNGSSTASPRRIPLSPKLDSSTTYGSPGSVIPRRSRGLDFSRACTNLHHSTLAEQSNQDMSPISSGKPMMIPPRKGAFNHSHGLDMSGTNSSSLWFSTGHSERNGLSSSVGSVNMLDSDSSNSDSDGDEFMEPDDLTTPIMTTPQVYKLVNEPQSMASTSPTAAGTNSGTSSDWIGNQSPATRSLMSFQRARLHKGRSKKSSSSASASGGSSMPSPGPGSPPAIKSIEGIHGYFGPDNPTRTGGSRRNSLSWGARELRISSSGDDEDGGLARQRSALDTVDMVTPKTPLNDEKGTVIRRPVTRRGNLLPKSKNFARIQAALMEEGAPVDTEVLREAEVVRQVRENDVPAVDASLTESLYTHPISQPATADSSPTLMPMVPGLDSNFHSEDLLGSGSLADSASSERNPLSDGGFTAQVKRHSGGREFWEHFDGLAATNPSSATRTPPPPPHFYARAGSMAISDDMSMDSPIAPPSILANTTTNNNNINSTTTRLPPLTTTTTNTSSTQSHTRTPTPQPSAVDLSKKINQKRRRDDDFDDNSFKRRAVSPGMSVQNSPVLAGSPGGREGLWGKKSGGEMPEKGGGKRVGMQGMVDTNDGLMKMSIE